MSEAGGAWENGLNEAAWEAASGLPSTEAMPTTSAHIKEEGNKNTGTRLCSGTIALASDGFEGTDDVGHLNRLLKASPGS